MGRNQNTVEKRVREMSKKRKAEEKRVLRREKKYQAGAQPVVANTPLDINSNPSS